MQQAIKTSMSIPLELYEQAKVRQAAFNYASFSDYLQSLIRMDVHSGLTEHVYTIKHVHAYSVKDSPDAKPETKPHAKTKAK